MARKNATVFISTYRNHHLAVTAIADIKRRLRRDRVSNAWLMRTGDIRTHTLDLSTIQSAADSAREFRRISNRLDILIVNTASKYDSSSIRISPDGYEVVFQEQFLSHFTFIAEILEFVVETSFNHGDARIIGIVSDEHEQADFIDFKNIRAEPGQYSMPNLGDGAEKREKVRQKRLIDKYERAKLAVLVGFKVLAEKMKEQMITNILVNFCCIGM